MTLPIPPVEAHETVQFAIDTIAQQFPIGAQNLGIPSWREVGAAGQPGFNSTWANAGDSTMAFRSGLGNLLLLKGRIAPGASGTINANQTVFTLPAGYRPSQNRRVTINVYDGTLRAPGIAFIQTSGAVAIYSEGTGITSATLVEANLETVVPL